MMQLKSWFTALVMFQLMTPDVVKAQLGIPGAAGTASGYDTEGGFDPICWFTPADSGANTVKTPFPNPLVENFTVEGIQLLQVCPSGVNINISLPEEVSRGEKLRLFEWYNYTINVTIQMESLRGDHIQSDKGDYVAIQVLLCKLGRGFCSPFVHEQANVREGRIGTTKRGNLHGGSHIHSPYMFVETARGPNVHTFSREVPMLVNVAGDYFVIGAVQLYTARDGRPISFRYDAANTSQKRIITYFEPPIVLGVVKAIVYFAWVLIGLAGLVQLFLLEELLRNRKNQVLKLCQVHFLTIKVFFALVSTVGAFTMEPRNDHLCQWSLFIVLLPLHIQFSIVFGRIWRINKVISPLLKGPTRSRFSLMISSAIDAAVKTVRPSNRVSKLRTTVTEAELFWVVIFLCIPQVIVQVLAVVLQPTEIIVLFNEEESIGSPRCSIYFGLNLQTFGFALFLLVVLMVLWEAFACRNLPSLFNETKTLFSSSLVNIGVIAIAAIILRLVSSPETGPSLPFIFWVLLAIIINLNSTVPIVFPKLQMVWRGEKVVVSSLVSDHKQQEKARRQRAKRKSGSSLAWRVSLTNVSGFRPNTGSDAVGKGEGQVLNSATEPVSSFERKDDSNVESNVEQFEDDTLGLTRGHTRRGSRFRLTDEETPPHAFVVPLIELKSRLAEITDKITTGVVVQHDEWEELRKMNSDLAYTFSGRVVFSWEESRLEDGSEPDE